VCESGLRVVKMRRMPRRMRIVVGVVGMSGSAAGEELVPRMNDRVV
jgi:hypothetical protein